MSFKKIILIILLAGVAIIMKLNMTNNNIIKTNLTGDFPNNNLDPATLNFVQEYYVLDNLSIKLVYLGKNEEYQNELAESIVFSENKKVITVTLRNALFSDGSKITSEDVSKSFKRAILRGAPHIDIENLFKGGTKLKSIDDEMEGIKIINENVIQLTLVQPTKEILFYFTLTDLAILHKSQYKKGQLTINDWSSITSGPYKLKVLNSDEEKTSIQLVANDKAYNYSDKMPQVVTFESYKTKKIMEHIDKLSFDFGTINFKDYYKNIKTINEMEHIQVVDSQSDGITHLDLNIKSKLFAKAENRQWVQKKILQNFTIEKQYSAAAKKAHQFFLPEAKGHIKLANINKILGHVDTEKVPLDLQNGFTIKSISGMKYYLPEGFAETLSKTLGIEVKIDLSVSSDEFKSFKKNRDFDATIMSTAMSYKVIGEALNLQYLSENPSFLDPTGKIKKYVKDYQSKDNVQEEYLIINKILEQMVVDSECVPLFYFSSPFFINHKRLDVDDLNLDESIKFYKMVVQ